MINDVGVKFESFMYDLLKQAPSSFNGMGTYYHYDKEKKIQTLNDYAIHEALGKENRNYFCHCMSVGTIAICLSHLSILQDAYDRGYKTIWVLEDDIQVAPGKNPNILSELIEKLDQTVGEANGTFHLLIPIQKIRMDNMLNVEVLHLVRNFVPLNPGRFAHRQPIERILQKLVHDMERIP